MKMLIDFNVNHKLTFAICTIFGALLSHPLPVFAAGADSAARSPFISRQNSQLPSYDQGGNHLKSLSPSASALLKNVRPEEMKNLMILNASSLFDTEHPLSLAQIQTKVFEEDKRFFIDFSNIADREEKSRAVKQLKHLLGVGFSSDMLMIGQYKGELIYTPIENDNRQLVERALKRKSSPLVSLTDKRIPPSVKSGSPMVPHVAFYLEVDKLITKDECSFPASPIWNFGEKELCKNANISLIYRVNWMRSLALGVAGSATPDAKLVRISLDADSAGAGVYLNNSLDIHKQKLGLNLKLDDWWRSYTTSAIAKDYKFSISSSNNIPSILKTLPANNQNKEYTERVSSAFEIGASVGTDLEKDNAKAKMEASASYTQTRMLIFNTAEYRIVRSAPNAQHISFIWERENAATAESLLSKYTGVVWDDSHPIATNKINPIAYQGFTPNFDVVYKAAPNATGSTTFTIDSSVNLWPVTTAAYYHFYGIGQHLSFQAQEHWQHYRRVAKSVPFEVDWNHPVFTGGRPVNLQLGQFNDQCISYGDNAKVEIASCKLDSREQSFIYDHYGRYVSASDTKKCLDIDNLHSFQACNMNLSQLWKWVDHSDHLQNEYRNKYLAHDGENLVSVSGDEKNHDMRIITRFTNIFSR